jgi:hypothetical protein
MRLISEINENIHCITEAKEDGGKNYFIEGTIMQGDIQNKNGRMYPSKVLAKEASRYSNSYIEKNRAYGELGHPDGPTINLDRVSHMFTVLRQEGSNIVGKAKVMDTPMGKIVKNLIDEGASLGISSRGLGSVKENKQGIMEVQSDFMLATAGDIVADPSAPDAFVKGIMEGVEFYFDLAEEVWKRSDQMVAKQIEQVVDELEEVARKSPRELEEEAYTYFNRFINSLSA